MPRIAAAAFPIRKVEAPAAVQPPDQFKGLGDYAIRPPASASVSRSWSRSHETIAAQILISTFSPRRITTIYVSVYQTPKS